MSGTAAADKWEGRNVKGIWLTAPQTFSYQELPRPELTPGSARVKVERVGICGSDLKIFSGENPFARLPLIPGHEFAGTVSEVDYESRFKVGDRVVAMPLLSCGTCEYCQKGEVNHCAELSVLGVHRHGAYADEVVLPERLLFPLPNDLPWGAAALVEPVAVAVHNMRRGAVKTGDRVLVLGAGTIGLLIVSLAKLSGAAHVTVTDLFPSRLALAREFKADTTVNVKEVDIRDIAAAQGGFNVVFDVVGNRKTLDDATFATRPGGRIVLVGVPHEPYEAVNVKNIFAHELVFTASRLYDAQDFAQAVTLMGEKRIPAEKLLSLTLPLAGLAEGLERLKSDPEHVIKVLLQP